MKDAPNRMIRFSYQIMGANITSAKYVVFWGHGWGQDGKSFAALVETLSDDTCHILFDLPGFGSTEPPPNSWDTGDYANAAAAQIQEIYPNKPVLWVGHSFGGRIGIQLAARHPKIISGLILLASAGIPKKRTFPERAKLSAKVYFFKAAKQFGPRFGWSLDELRNKFGSADYKSAGPLRDVFLRVIREDLSETAKNVKCPTILIYGADDKETPPDIGQRLAQLIPKAYFCVLPRLNHYTLLSGGKHLVANRIMTFLEKL